MPYCERCGKEIPEDATYCPECGTPVQAPVERLYRRAPSPGWDIGRILALFIGFIIVATSFGLIVGGGTIMW
ncbi:MAG: zinc-ribbon domain-containing protein, partial [Candidatus Hermodarchaeia archaeon]